MVNGVIYLLILSKMLLLTSLARCERGQAFDSNWFSSYKFLLFQSNPFNSCISYTKTEIQIEPKLVQGCRQD
jgi:hypothetical protein